MFTHSDTQEYLLKYSKIAHKHKYNDSSVWNITFRGLVNVVWSKFLFYKSLKVNEYWPSRFN